ncbi:MAG: alpha/beta hydrolase [Candidatus Thorarchaeota archaeon]|nr:alpha/beta hydrolase [Candidatus Thorarchaeota archaeon]
MPFFDFSGTRIHYVDIQPKESTSVGMPIVFVHGAGSSHISWSLQLREFSKTNRSIALDLSGHGESDDGKPAVSIEDDYTSELKGLITHLGLQDFILVGHSMGGAVAMSYVLREDTVRPRGLVLVDTSSSLDLSKLALGLAIEAVEDRLLLFRNRSLEEFTDTYKIKRIEEQTRLSNPEVLRRDLAACDRFDITSRLSQIEVPTFVLVGDDDDIVPPRIAKSLQKSIPRSDIAVVRKADHAPMIENPEEFNRLLRRFVKWVESHEA